MFTATATMRLKANTALEFNRLIENEILPMLRRQAGFRDWITFVAPGCSEAVAFTSWDAQGNREGNSRTTDPELLKIAAKVEGTPRVKISEVSNSTIRKLAVIA